MRRLRVGMPAAASVSGETDSLSRASWTVVARDPNGARFVGGRHLRASGVHVRLSRRGRGEGSAQTGLFRKRNQRGSVNAAFLPSISALDVAALTVRFDDQITAGEMYRQDDETHRPLDLSSLRLRNKPVCADPSPRFLRAESTAARGRCGRLVRARNRTFGLGHRLAFSSVIQDTSGQALSGRA
jgi:hypothetical protein